MSTQQVNLQFLILVLFNLLAIGLPFLQQSRTLEKLDESKVRLALYVQSLSIV